MDYAAFLDQCYADEEKRAEGAKFIERFIKIIGDKKIEDALRDKQVITKIFYSDEAADISTTYYKAAKKHLLRLVTWLNQQGTLTDGDKLVSKVKGFSMRKVLSQDKIEASFFPDYDSVIDYVDVVGTRCFYNYVPADTLNIKAIFTLSWLGVSPEEAIALKKTDLNTFGSANSKTYVLSGLPDGRTIIMNKRQYSILSDYANSEVFKGLPAGKRVTYKESDFLVRAGYRDMAFSPTSIYSVVKRFNSVLIRLGEHKAMSYKNLRVNAIFETIWHNEKKYYYLRQVVMEALNSNEGELISGYKPRYLAWKEKFHSE